MAYQITYKGQNIEFPDEGAALSFISAAEGQKSDKSKLRKTWETLNPLGGTALATAEEAVQSQGKSIPASLMGIADAVSFGLIPQQEKVSNYLKDEIAQVVGGNPQKTDFSAAQTEYPNSYSGGQTIGSILNPINIATAGRPVLNTLGNVVQGQTNLPGDAPIGDRFGTAGIDLLATLGGRALGNKLLPPELGALRPNVRQDVAAGIEDIKQITGKTIPISYDSVTKNRAPDVLGQTARGTPLVHGGFSKTGETGVSTVHSVLDVSGFGQSTKNKTSEMMSSLGKALDSYNVETQKLVGPLYDQASQSTGAIPYPPEIIDAAKNFNNQIKTTLIPDLEEGPAKKAIETIIAEYNAQGKQPITTIAELAGTRESLNSILQTDISPKSQRILLGLKSSVDDSLSRIAEEGGGSAIALRKANKIYSERQQAKPNIFLKSAEKYLPGSNKGTVSSSKSLKIIDKLSRENMYEDLTKLKQIAGDSWTPIQDKFKFDLFHGPNGDYDVFEGVAGSPNSFKFIKKLSKYDDKTLNLFLSPDEVKVARGLEKVVPWLEDAIRATKLVKPNILAASALQGGGTVGAGLVLGKSLGLGMMGSAGVGLGLGATYMVGNKVIDYIFNNPAAIKRLMHLSKFTAGQKAGKQFMIQAVKSALEGNTSQTVLEE